MHDSHIDGLDAISNRLINLNKSLLRKTYDPLDFRKPDFDNDYGSIRNSIDDIQMTLEAFMDKAIDTCPTAMHALVLLERFRLVCDIRMECN